MHIQPYLEAYDLTSAIEYIEHHLLTFEPIKYVHQYIKNVKDLYEYRIPLKKINGNNKIISHIASIIIKAIDNHQKLRTLECLKILRALTKKIDNKELTPSTIEMLFRIYQEFIFRPNEQIQWCVSAIIKTKLLGDDAIEWLIKNQHKSEHIVNRLLLYPTSHPKIKLWAEKIYKKKLFEERRSELIALIIDHKNIEQLTIKEDLNTMSWAIYKAHLNRIEKIDLLKKYCDFESFASVVEIADRLQSPPLLKYLLR